MYEHLSMRWNVGLEYAFYPVCSRPIRIVLRYGHLCAELRHVMWLYCKRTCIFDMYLEFTIQPYHMTL